MYSLDEMNDIVKKYGNVLSLGINANEYKKAINRKYEKLNIKKNKVKIDYDINKYYTYKDIENIIYKLSSYDMVNTFIIGKTKSSNNIYMIEVGTGDKVIMVTGNVHARELIGTSIIIKELIELLNNNIMLNQYKIIAIPCVNPDGREICINGNKKFKANANYVDINRNFPTSNAMQYKYDNKKTKYSLIPSSSNYSGKYLGSEEETKAVMSVVNKYIKNCQYFIDFHQAGNLVYGGKSYDEINKNNISRIFRNIVCNKLNYKPKEEEKELTGGGEGSLTDYVTEMASGFIFNEKWGRLTYNNEILLLYESVNKNLNYYKPVNNNIAIITIEVGNSNSKGYSKRNRKKQDKIYNKKFKSFFNWLIRIK